jgi:hypothetical protein
LEDSNSKFEHGIFVIFRNNLNGFWDFQLGDKNIEPNLEIFKKYESRTILSTFSSCCRWLWRGYIYIYIYIYIYFQEFIIYNFFENYFSQNGKSSLKTSWPIFTQSGHQPQKNI